MSGDAGPQREPTSGDAGPTPPADGTPTSGGVGPQLPADGAPADGTPADGTSAALAPTEAEREAARLRYELNRLRAKRSVRAALLLAEGTSPRALLATLRGTRVRPDLDTLPPATVRRRPRYPHLRVGHLAARPPFGDLAAPHVRLAPDAPLAGADLDVLVLDPPDAAAAARLRADARTLGVTTVALVRDPGQAGAAAALDPELTVVLAGAAGADVAGPGVLVLPPWVDPTVDNPIGWTTPGPLRTLTDDADHDHLTHQALAEIARGHLVTVPDPAALTAPIADLLADPATAADADAAERHSVRARREVLGTHDGTTRFEAVLAALGWPVRPAPRISVLLCTRRAAYLAHALEQVDRQDHPDVELVAVLHGDDLPADAETQVQSGTRWPTTVLRVPGRVRFGEALNAGLDAATGELVAKMDDDDHYGARHLSDLLVALRYSGADAVGRWANEVHLVARDETVTSDADRQERWAHHLPGATLLVHADVLRALRFRPTDRAIDTHLLRALHRAGGSAYATHRFGFVRVRHGDRHTFERGDTGFDARAARSGLDRSVLDV